MKINKFINIVLVSFLILGFSACEDKKELKDTLVEKRIKLPKPEWDSRLSDVEVDSGIWFQQADDNEKAAYNIANTYRKKIKDYNRAIEWYLYSDSIKTDIDNLFNLSLTYEDMKDYDNAINYYKKAFELEEAAAANRLGVLYQDILKDYKKSEVWYKKAIEMGSEASLKGITDLYHFNLKDDVKASAYLLNLITYSNFKKKKVINRLKNHYKLSDETIKKGYELQLKMEGLPRRYTGGI